MSSSLVTSYNSDAGGDQLRVREAKKACNSTKRSRTSPSSFNKKNKTKLSPNRIREALNKISKNDRLDLKRMMSSEDAGVQIKPIYDCPATATEINSLRDT